MPPTRYLQPLTDHTAPLGAGEQDKVPGESMAHVCCLLFADRTGLPFALSTGSRLGFGVYQGDPCGCFSPRPFSGTLNCPVHAIQSSLSFFAFGRGKRGDSRKQRANIATYT